MADTMGLDQLNLNTKPIKTEKKEIDRWVIERAHQSAAVPYTTFIIKSPLNTFGDRGVCYNVFDCIAKTFSFTKINAEYVPEMDSYSILIPGHDSANLEVYLKEIISRFNLLS